MNIRSSNQRRVSFQHLVFRVLLREAVSQLPILFNSLYSLSDNLELWGKEGDYFNLVTRLNGG